MANMETIGERRGKGIETPVSEDKCEFEGYDVLLLMSETEKMRKLITKRGTLEIIMPLCCSTNPVRYKTFRQAMKGFSTRTLSNRLNELEKNGQCLFEASMIQPFSNHSKKLKWQYTLRVTLRRM